MKTIHIAHTVTKTVKSKEFFSSSYDHNVSVLYLKPFLGILVKFFNSANKPFLRKKINIINYRLFVWYHMI